MLRISEIKLDLDCDFHDIEEAAAKTLKLNKNRILKTEIFKQSVDCRKGEVRFVFTVDVTIDGDEDRIVDSLNNNRVIKTQKYEYKMPQSNRTSTLPPVVAGFGPAGIFAAMALAIVVLYNLNNINVNERIRELATLKVLGFYNGEVSAYIYRENVILTIIGYGVFTTI